MVEHPDDLMTPEELQQHWKEVLFGIMRALLPFINRHDKDRFFLIRLTFFLNRLRFFAHFYLNIVTFLRRVSLKKGSILGALKHRLPLR